MRSVSEWIGQTDDAHIPERVKLRVFHRFNGICHISKRKIRAGEPWDCDHIIALCNGGEHRESNLAPALRDKHKEKSRADAAEKSMINRKRKRDLGIKRRKRTIPGRKFDGTPIPARWR